MEEVNQLKTHATEEISSPKLRYLINNLIEKTNKLSSVFQEIDDRLKNSTFSNSQELVQTRDNIIESVFETLKNIIKHEETLLVSQLFKPKRKLENFVNLLTHQISKISDKNKVQDIKQSVDEFIKKSENNLKIISEKIRDILTKVYSNLKHIRDNNFSLDNKDNSLSTFQIEDLMRKTESELEDVSRIESKIDQDLVNLSEYLAREGKDIKLIDYISTFKLNFNKDLSYIIKRINLSRELISYAHLIENKIYLKIDKQQEEIKKSFFKKTYIEVIKKEDENLKNIQREGEEIDLSNLRESKKLVKIIKNFAKTALIAAVVMFNTACDNQIKQNNINPKPQVVLTTNESQDTIKEEVEMNEAHDLQTYLKFELDGISGEKNKQEAWRSYKVGLISRGKNKAQELNIKSASGVKRLGLLKNAFDQSLDEVIKITLNKEVKYQSEDKGQSMFQVFLDGNNNCRESTMLFCAFVEEVDPQMFEDLLTINTPGHIMPGIQTKNVFNQTTLTGCELTAKGTAIVKNMQKVQHRAILAKHQMILMRTKAQCPQKWIVSEKMDGENYNPEKYGGTKSSDSNDKYASSTAFGSSNVSNQEMKKSEFNEKEAEEDNSNSSRNSNQSGAVIKDINWDDVNNSKSITHSEKKIYQNALREFLDVCIKLDVPLYRSIGKENLEYVEEHYNCPELTKALKNEMISGMIIHNYTDIYNKAIDSLQNKGVSLSLKGLSNSETIELINKIYKEMKNQL